MESSNPPNTEAAKCAFRPFISSNYGSLTTGHAGRVAQRHARRPNDNYLIMLP